MAAQSENSSSAAQPWIGALRLRTLPLATASILLGAFLAAADGTFDFIVTLLCLLTALTLQILSNLANDYGDFVHGADAERVGPLRYVQSGLITPAAMRRAMALTAAIAAVLGLALIIRAVGLARLPVALAFVAIGGAALWAAISYTAGRNPYGYIGLGDLFVLIFFGWAATLGTYYLQALTLRWSLLLPATAAGLLAVGVLNVNNIRDIHSDAVAGKRTVPVRLGLARARRYHLFLLTAAAALALLYVTIEFRSAWQFLFLLTVPALVRNGWIVAHAEPPHGVAPMLKQLSLSTLLFVLTFGIGQLLA